MICPYCHHNHPDDCQFCPNTGRKIELLKACSNSDCTYFGKHILPLEGVFCPICGGKLEQSTANKKGNIEKGIALLNILQSILVYKNKKDIQYFFRYCPNCYYEEMKTNQSELNTYCPKCNYKLKDGKRKETPWQYKALICSSCGHNEETRQPYTVCPKCKNEMKNGIICRHCHKVTFKNSNYCIHCGKNPNN